MKTEKVTEVVIFKMNATVNEHEALTALQSLQTLVEVQPGYIARQLSKNEEKVWMDCVQWESLSDAKLAAEKLMQTPAAVNVFSKIDPSTIQMFHFEPIYTW
jgi:hypothetical protein